MSNEKKQETITTMEVAVIGGGPGGYETAIRLNQKGINVTLFEKERIGGECLNWGCIPTKAMVKPAELYGELQNLPEYGLEVENVSIDFQQIMKRKNEVVERLTGGLDYMFKRRKIPVVGEEVCRIEKQSETLFEIETKAGSIYNAQYVVVATGSKSMELPFLPFDGVSFLSSRDILSLDTLPKSLAIIGGGTVGCEFASIFANLGVKVEIIEMLPTLLCNEDKEIARRLTMSFKKKGIAVHTNTKVVSATTEGSKTVLTTDKGKTIEAEKVLISTGRVPTCSIDLHGLNIEREREKILIDSFMETKEKNLFAIGDVTGKLMLAHTASKQGLIVADIIENRLKDTDNTVQELTYLNIPRCTFTDPELASVGLTEEQAKEKYEKIVVGKFMYLANGKALASGYKEGFIKVIATKDEKKIVGMHIFGSVATELIALGGMIIGLGLAVEDLRNVVYAHPTISEVVMEAIDDLDGLAIHKV